MSITFLVLSQLADANIVITVQLILFLQQMTNEKIEDTTFSIILQVSKDYNRDDMSSTHRQILKTADFVIITVLLEFIGDRIHTLITDEKS